MSGTKMGANKLHMQHSRAQHGTFSSPGTVNARTHRKERGIVSQERRVSQIEKLGRVECAAAQFLMDRPACVSQHERYCKLHFHAVPRYRHESSPAFGDVLVEPSFSSAFNQHPLFQGPPHLTVNTLSGAVTRRHSL